jgi:thioester reductase-like protein
MSNSAVNILNLEEEAVLDPAIGFDNPLSENSHAPKSIFLTGATGFIGAYLLDELLHKTTADIYCLIRCSDTEAGKQRLKQHLECYSLWQEVFSSRIIPVVGDLSQPLFGLSQQKFNKLAERIDVIYHNGCHLDFSVPYSVVKPTNVLGTEEILRLASLTQTKPVHFISTVVVFFSQAYSQAYRVKETDIPVFDIGLNNSYKQSKWVAEQLVRIAQERGLPACIYRPTRIMGHSKTGIYRKFNNFFLQFVKACIQLGKFPALDVELNIVPVDYCSQAIVHLSQQEKSLCKAFHIVNPQPISWKKLLKLICFLGYSIKEITYDKWLMEIQDYASSNQGEKNMSDFPLPKLLNAAKVISAEKPQFDARQTMKGLADTSIACPTVDLQLISTYFLYFKKSGYIS